MSEYRWCGLAMLGRTEEAEAEARRAYVTEQKPPLVPREPERRRHGGRYEAGRRRRPGTHRRWPLGLGTAISRMMTERGMVALATDGDIKLRWSTPKLIAAANTEVPGGASGQQAGTGPRPADCDRHRAEERRLLHAGAGRSLR